MAAKIALALQGGGAHAAFSWGVIERLLDHVVAGSIEICGVSGASTGALNATALAYGLREGAELPGPATARKKRMVEAAKAKIEELWAAIARAAFWGGNPYVSAIGLIPGWNIDDSPAARWADMTSTGVVQADASIGAYLNAVLRDVLPQLPAILATPVAQVPVVQVAATEVRECRRQIFVDGAISPEALKASMCVPSVLHGIEIADNLYWDGGYMGNPPLSPLLEQASAQDCHDLVLVSVNPLHRDLAPRSMRQCQDRLNEITFSASLVHEVNAIETLNRLIDAGHVTKASGLRRVNLHRIHADGEMGRLGIYSKDAPAWDFLEHLRDLGHDAFDAAWPNIKAALGKCSSWDTEAICDHVVARRGIVVERA